MAGKVNIDRERCKGCGLCLEICPQKSITLSEHSNQKGYFPARTSNENCTGCGLCAIICPEACIEVLRENNIVSKPQKTAKTSNDREKV